MAKAQPTSTLMAMPATKTPSTVITTPMTDGRQPEGPDAPAHDVVGKGAGHADQQARRGGQEGGKGAGRDQRAEGGRRRHPAAASRGSTRTTESVCPVM